jgi:hypothetical protein
MQGHASHREIFASSERVMNSFKPILQRIFTKESESGIAIGAILFVVAILGVLAAAMAAGSGSFTMGSSSETNKTKAAAVIEIGQNLKMGSDRITGSVGIDLVNVTISSNNTTNQTDLFSVSGGGISPPSVTMAGNVQSDVWYYPRGAVPGLGDAAGDEQLAILNISIGVCQEINSKLFGNTDIPSGAFGAAALNVANSTVHVDTLTSAWPTILNGMLQGCVQNTSDTAGGYYFYQILGIQ